MANTINDLYQKYTNKVGRTLENDRYFQYLYAMVESSHNTFLHHHQVLHKVVDERWLSIIEESLDDINTIIEKPRRFVTTKEEVVPVALAKKITADSVRHLSMNTQFIASDENGDIQPTRILNVSTEESFDLYENRFIYHLIQRLVTFIDKRTDVIFWSTGDETSDTMKLESTIDDAYEQINYKIELTVKNNQNFVENDSDNMNVFMRIDHVRRLVMALRQSSFCSLMAGCAKVHSPIQRTNLMMKDPHYRACYKLWQFLESYDEVGYTIDVQQTPMEFDEEYMIQMYTNLITNYTVFKSLLETDKRRIDETPVKKRRIIKPKFVKQIQEEFVLDRDIPEVEIRKVFLEEVTQAQLDAEAKVESLTIELEETREALDNAEFTSQNAMMQVNGLMQAQMELEAALEEEKEARVNAEAELEQLTQDAEAAIAEAEAEKERIIEEAKADKEKAVAETIYEKNQIIEATIVEKNDAIAKAEEEKNDAIAKAEEEKNDAIAKAEEEKNEAIAAAEIAKNEAIELANAEKQQAINIAEEEKQSAIAKINAEKDEAIALANKEKENAIVAVELDKNRAVVAANAEKEQGIARAEKARDKAIARAEEEKNSAIALAEEEKNTAIAKAEEEKNTAIAAINSEKDRALAEMKAELEKYKEKLSSAENSVAKLSAEKDELNDMLAKEKSDRAEAEARIKKESEEHITKIRTSADQAIDTAKKEAEAEVESVRKNANTEIEAIKITAEKDIEAVKVEADARVAEAETKAKAATEAKEARNSEVEELNDELRKKQATVNKLEKKVQKLKASRRLFGKKNISETEADTDKE